MSGSDRSCHSEAFSGRGPWLQKWEPIADVDLLIGLGLRGSSRAEVLGTSDFGGCEVLEGPAGSVQRLLYHLLVRPPISELSRSGQHEVKISGISSVYIPIGSKYLQEDLAKPWQPFLIQKASVFTVLILGPFDRSS